MEMIILISKLILLFIGIVITVSNFAKIYYKQTVELGYIIFQALAITGFIGLQWLI